MGRTAALICSAAVAPWLIALAVALAYANAFGGGFQFDDFNVIVDNPTVHSWAAWWSRMPGLRPLLKLTYTANWVSGFGVAGFHAVNILLHLANALLVFAISRPVLMDAGLAPDLAARVALPAALLFALHPAQTEAVTYVSGRSVSLMALFYLVAIACHLRARVDGGAIPWRAGALAAFVLAFAAKEVAWTLPLAIVLIELQRNSGAWRPTLRATRPYLIVLAVVGVAAFFVPGYWRLLMSSFDTRSLAANLLTQIAGQYHLLAEPLLTLRLNVDPDLPVREAWSADLALKAAVLVGLIAIAVLQWRQRRWIALGIFWFFVHLAATNTVLPRYDVANDRQLYLALIGPAWIIATALLSWRRRHAAVAIVVLSLLLGGATIWRNRDYAGEVAFWEATVRASPRKGRVWNNLGFARQQAGDLAGARTAYERAIELDPEDYRALTNLGTLEP